MQIVSIKTRSQEHIGFVDGDEVIDLKVVDNRVPAQFGRLANGNGRRVEQAARTRCSLAANARQAQLQIQFGLPVH